MASFLQESIFYLRPFEGAAGKSMTVRNPI